MYRPCQTCRLPRLADAPLPRLVGLLWRLAAWLLRLAATAVSASWRLLHRAAGCLTNLRHARGVVVLAQVTHPQRAALLEQTLRRVALRQARALAFTLPDPVVILVAQTVDPYGAHASLLEREARPDGSTRYVLQLAFAPQERAAPLGLDALAAELGRLLLRLQREVEGGSVAVLDDVSEPPLADSGGPLADTRAFEVVPFPRRNGHHAAQTVYRPELA